LPEWLDRRLPSIDLEGAEHEGDEFLGSGDAVDGKEREPALA
jgi:hypothetical protein